MQGLNTAQIVGTLTPISYNHDVGQTQAATNFVYASDSPPDLINVLGAVFIGDQQVWIKRLYLEACFVQNALWPCICEVTWLRARKDQVVTLATTLIEDAPSATVPFASPFTGDNFRKNYKILKSKRVVMKPSIPYFFKCKSLLPYRGRPVSRDVQGDTSVTYQHGNTMMFFRFYGIPNQHIPPTAGTQMPNLTALSSIVVRGTFRRYCSFYTMNDIDPTPSLSSTFNATMISENQAYNATLYNAAKQESPALSGDYIYPNTVQTIT